MIVFLLVTLDGISIVVHAHAEFKRHTYSSSKVELCLVETGSEFSFTERAKAVTTHKVDSQLAGNRNFQKLAPPIYRRYSYGQNLRFNQNSLVM